MSFKPTLAPLVCPFCDRACDHPPDHNEHPASCGCGALVIVADEIRDDRTDLEERVAREGREVEVRIVQHVDFYGPPAAEGEEPQAAEGEGDGDYADALFYRFTS